jgi:prevent-host-death family protein
VRKQHSIAEARSNLPRLIREAESGEPIELTRRGEGVAVLVGRRQFERLSARSRRFSDAFDEFIQEVDLSELEIDPDEIFKNVRDAQPGRDVKV